MSIAGHERIRSGGMFEGIQAMRFVAAFMVLITHATFFINSRMDKTVTTWEAGAQGVPLFFVISGFVMVITSHRPDGSNVSAGYFITSRLIRIVPLYYLLNFLKIIQINISPQIALAQPNTTNIIFSLLFLPSRNANGVIETFYGVGWTLNFEMFFYAIFAAALAIRANVLLFSSVIILLFYALSFFRQESWPAITYFASPILLNFIWGMLLGKFARRGVRIHPGISAAMVLVGMSIIFAAPHLEMFQLQYAVVIAGAIFLEPWIRGRIPRPILFGGDASYSLYLVHPMVAVAVVLVAMKLGMSVLPTFITIVIACLAASAITYRWFEKPVTNLLRNRYLKRPARQPDAVPASD